MGPGDHHPTDARVRTVAVALLATTLAVSSAACARTSLTGGDSSVGGSGVVRLVPPADREDAPDVSGTTLDGERFDLSQHAGRTVVVNVWGSWCAPCRKEAPALAEVSRRYADRDVRFVGIAVRENEAAARAFAERTDMPYPSIFDPTSQTVLGFADSLPSQAVPTTWVVDDRGRVAARVLDDVSASTLSGLIDDVTAGEPGTDGSVTAP